MDRLFPVPYLNVMGLSGGDSARTASQRKWRRTGGASAACGDLIRHRTARRLGGRGGALETGDFDQAVEAVVSGGAHPEDSEEVREQIVTRQGENDERHVTEQELEARRGWRTTPQRWRQSPARCCATSANARHGRLQECRPRARHEPFASDDCGVRRRGRSTRRSSSRAGCRCRRSTAGRGGVGVRGEARRRGPAPSSSAVRAELLGPDVGATGAFEAADPAVDPDLGEFGVEQVFPVLGRA
jgi:hypothetical protein